MQKLHIVRLTLLMQVVFTLTITVDSAEMELGFPMNQPSASAPMAAEGLSSQDGIALESALNRLKAGDFQSRWDAAKLIPHYGESAVLPLLDLLQDEGDGELIWFTARILGNLPYPAAIRALVELVHTDHPEIAAVSATALVNFGVAAIPALTEMLAQPSTKLIAVQALAQIREPAVISALLQVVQDPEPAVRAAAIEALSHFYEDDITAVLCSALQDVATPVRRAAVIALGVQSERLDRQQLTQSLSPMLWDLNLEVCQQAAIALGRIGTEAAIAALAQALQSAHTPIQLQFEIVRALAWTGTEAALAQLQQALDLKALPPAMTGRSTGQETQPGLDLGQEIAAVLGRVTGPIRPLAVKILLHLLDTNHPLAQTKSGKQQIALSLGQLQDPAAIDALIKLLIDPEITVRLHALAALKQLEAQGAYARLQTLVTDAATDPALQSGLQIALREWHIHAS